jgi:hypothetical protein
MADSESACLNSIPNELLGQIGGYLDQGSLYSLALVCRHTKEPAYGSLYQSYTNLDIEKPVVLFLRTIVRRPDLAGKVKSITVRNWDAQGVAMDRHIDEIVRFIRDTCISVEAYDARYQQAMQTLESGPFDEEFFDYLLRLAQATRLIPSEDWSGALGLPRRYHLGQIPDARRSNQYDQFVRSLWNNVEDAYMIILLSSLPNLKDLGIKKWLTESERPMLEWAWFSHHFSNIKTFQVEGDYDHQLSRFSLGYVLKVKHLTVLKLQYIELVWNTFAAQTTVEQNLPMRIKTMILRDMSITLQHLRILTQRGGIEHFEYSYEVEASSSRGIEYVHPAYVLPCLEASKASLRHMDLTSPFWDNYAPLSPVVQHPLENLASFDHLISLRISVWALLQLSEHHTYYDIDFPSDAVCARTVHLQLPKTLVSLELSEAPCGVFRLLTRLLKFIQQGDFPLLKNIRVGWYFCSSDTLQPCMCGVWHEDLFEPCDQISRLTEELRESGVTINFSYRSDSAKQH